MENATKALEMAASVLIGMLIIGMLVFGYTQISDLKQTEENAKQLEQSNNFNQQFEVYDKEGVYGSELLSLANRVGVGSLSGVSLSLYLGGIGSVFWMWISTIICSSTTMIETVVSLKYRKKINNYEYEGGPFYYISLGLKKYKLAILYAICIFNKLCRWISNYTI